MIRQKLMVQSYPSKTVLEDVAMRSGPPDKDSFTPFIGKHDLLLEQFCGTQMERFNIDGFLIENASFEFDPAKRNDKKVVGIMEIEEREEKQFLEDFIVDGQESESVKEWFIQACISYKKRKDSSYRKVDYTYNSVSYGDEENTFDPRMAETTKDDFNSSQEDYELALRKLPYYIKALWTYSRIYSANLFSFVAAYMDMLKNKRYTRDNIIVNYFSKYTTYMLKLDGTYKRRFDHECDIKTERYKKVTDIFCYPGRHKEIMSLVNEFIDICEILKIDFERQDTMIFNAEFIDKLVCTYIPTNSEYLKYYGEVDAEVMHAIKSDNLFSKTKLSIYSDPNKSIEENSRMENLMDYELRLKILYNTYSISPTREVRELFMGSKELAIKNLNAITYITTGKNLDMAPFVDLDGFLIRTKGSNEPLVIPTGALGPYAGVAKYEVMITQNGSVILRKYDADDTVFIPAESVITTIEENLDAGRKQNRWVSV